jgi:hypothetical protein
MQARRARLTLGKYRIQQFYSLCQYAVSELLDVYMLDLVDVAKGQINQGFSVSRYGDENENSLTLRLVQLTKLVCRVSDLNTTIKVDISTVVAAYELYIKAL